MITNENQLKEAIEKIQSASSNTSLLLFRGENQKYEQMRSGKARPNAFDIPEIENGWNTIVGRLIRDQNRSTEYKQSILQHYGYPTFYLDLTCDPLVAAWFSVYKFKKLEPIKWIGEIGFRLHNRTTYEKIYDGVGYLYILEIPNYKTFIESNLLFDISDEDLFIRPKKQSAFLMLDRNDNVCNPNNFVIHTLKIDRSQFSSSYDILDLFPHPSDDKGYNKLLDVPFIKNSFCYVTSDESTDHAPDYMTLDYFHSHSKRIIDIPFYLKEIDNLYNIKPKTKDITLFEPILFRNWKQLDRFNLADYFSVPNDVFLSDATKISLSPAALYNLYKADSQITLQWPKVNSDNILFIKTEYAHDVAGYEEQPYLGIWLYKYLDQIIESYIIIEEDGRNGVINIDPGNTYIVRNDVLKIAVRKSEELEDDVEVRIRIIKQFFKIHGLIEDNEVALLPNPFDVENWHILL
ncbi:FRG domain-containing protein [Sphingobacterium bambusae]|uniref:FRG domain-containing protein n=1 Tax=Sphingobacterium bambusae TaxID=662858 RepID=A0ABW6BJM8_9SPHI|nr:FRG domain-containing protein [Sphingobacterium bambusae]WPL49424.1 FRG domain-containing protein [Sphingobacterium bambusae]